MARSVDEIEIPKGVICLASPIDLALDKREISSVPTRLIPCSDMNFDSMAKNIVVIVHRPELFESTATRLDEA